MNNLFDFLANVWPYLFAAGIVAVVGAISFIRWFVSLKEDTTGIAAIPFLLTLVMMIVIMVSVPFGTIGILCDIIRWGANLA